MQYISAEEFLKQPKKVQEVFIDWWNLEKGNLFTPICPQGIGVINGTATSKEGLIPLLTEGQLRGFIENKTGSNHMAFEYNNGQINIKIYDESGIPLYVFKKLGANVLKAYWEVAIIIAENIDVFKI